MALMPLTKLFVGLVFTVGASTAIVANDTCKNDGDCEGDTRKVKDITALFQSKNAKVQTALVLPKDDPNMASIRPRVQKLMEINATVDDIKALLGAGATPEVANMIQDLIRIIEEDLQEKVKRDQTFAQSKVHERIAALTDTTEGAVEQKTHADQFDTSLDQCITEEHGMIDAYEVCKSEEAVLETEKPSAEYCGHPDFDVSYTPPEMPDTIALDYSKGLAHVHATIDQYFAPLQAWMDSLKVRVVNDKAKWDVANDRCKAKTKEVEDKTTECGERQEAWRVQNEKCMHAKHAQKVSLCEFGHAYQAKCTAKIAFEELRADIIGDGTSYSEPDRRQEWRQTTRLACVLHEFESTTELTTDAVETCTKSDDEAAEEFEKDVGSIDLKQTTYDLLRSQANFTCEEAAVELGSGVLWKVPEATAGVVGWIPKAIDYTKATGYKYAIESDSKNAPFDFCLGKGSHGTAPTCGSTFDCVTGSGSRKPADTQCHVAGGCTSADCCVDM